jgi:Flp pilus assembly protein CpaB
MKRARIIVIAIAFTAALGAAWIAKKIVSGPREVQQVEKTIGATDVVFTAKNIGLGDSVRSDDLKWQQWPVEGVTPGLITREAQPDAPSEFSSAVAREGCATQRNLAAMVANSEDLLYPGAETPRPSERRDVVLGKYVTGEPPGRNGRPRNYLCQSALT